MDSRGLFRNTLPILIGCAVVSCKLVNTEDNENVAGRGTRAFDPYAGPASGTIRLALQIWNGCAVLPTGEPIAKGAGNYPYPDDCNTSPTLPPDKAPVAKPLELLAGTDYFLNQVTMGERLSNVHTDPRKISEALDWMKSQSRFRNLDWSNVGVVKDEWLPTHEYPHPGTYNHRIEFGNSAWQLKKDDTYLLEVLDADGSVRQRITYDHGDFLAESSSAGHSLVAWEHAYVGPPRFPGDIEPQPPRPAQPGYPPPPPTEARTIIRIDRFGSTRPNKKFRIDSNLTGDGVIRLTWSLLPNEPFYIPVRFVRPDQVPATCYVDGDVNKRVPCSFGLEPVATFAPPANGKFYVPGEEFTFTLGIKDGVGNYLHPLDSFPSWHDNITNNANGITYTNAFHYWAMHEEDIASAAKIGGPIQEMATYYEDRKPSYFHWPMQDMIFIADFYNAFNAIPGGRDVRPTTTYTVKLPSNARPGTYVLLFKVNRFFMGERFTKTNRWFFPVGQEEPTRYPNLVGNCQICHRGVLSLDNLRHGMPVDDVEACKVCHNRDLFPVGRLFSVPWMVHRIHAFSNRYPMAKNDCTVCHLTRESTTRPSLMVCGSCHHSPHGGKYFEIEISDDTAAVNVFGNCANACHGLTPPKNHILPAAAGR